MSRLTEIQELEAVKEYLTQESFNLCGSERQRYCFFSFFPTSGNKEPKQLLPALTAKVVQIQTCCLWRHFSCIRLLIASM